MEPERGIRRWEIALVLCLIVAGMGLRLGLAAFFDLRGENLSDQVAYVSMARGLWMKGSFTVHGWQSAIYPPLYPVLLSAGTLAGEGDLWCFRILSTAAMATGLVPLWLLARRLLSGPSLYGVLTLISLLPSNLLLPTEFFSESLFYPLFWWWAWLGWRLVERPAPRNAIFWGGMTGALILTRSIGLALVPVLPTYLVTELFFSAPTGCRLQALKRALVIVAIACVVTVAVVAPWEFRNLQVHDAVVPVYREADPEIISVALGQDPLAWLHSGGRQCAHVALGCGLLFFALALPLAGRSDRSGSLARLTFWSLLWFTIAATYHFAFDGFPVPLMIFGRDLAQVYPLIVILGWVGSRRPVALSFLVTGFLMFLFPVPDYRDLESRFLLPLLWVTDSPWAIHGGLALGVGVLYLLCHRGQDRAARVAVVGLVLAADIFAVQYLHDIGRGQRNMVEFGRAVGEAAGEGPVLLDDLGGLQANGSRVRAAGELWGRVEMRDRPTGRETLLVSQRLDGERLDEEAGGILWVLPTRFIEGDRWIIVTFRSPSDPEDR